MNFSFLISSERSGSNLITKLIDSHPNYCGPSPTHLFRIYALNHKKYGDLNNNSNWEILIDDTLCVLESQFGSWKSQVTKEELLKEVVQGNEINLLRYIYEKEALTLNKTHVFVKELYTYDYINYLLDKIPDAQFLHLVRDPRDTALSFKKSPSHRKNIAEFVPIWLKDQEGTLSIAKQLSNEQFLTIRYEDILQAPESTLTKVSSFLNVPYNERMLTYHENKLTQENAQRMAAWKNLDHPLLTSNCGKFKNGLNASEIQYIEESCSEIMHKLNYSKIQNETVNIEKLKEEINIEIPKEKTLPMTPQEQNIRKKRMEAIQRIIGRDLK